MAKLTIKRISGIGTLVLDEGKVLVQEFFGMVVRDLKSKAIKYRLLKNSVVFEHRGICLELKAGGNGLANLTLAVSRFDKLEDALDRNGRFIYISNTRGSLNYYYYDSNTIPDGELLLYFTDTHSQLHPDFWAEVELYAAYRTGKAKNSYSIGGYNYVRNGLMTIISHITKRSYKWEVEV